VDTRNKILTLDAALALDARPLIVVTGTFDLLGTALIAQLDAARTSMLPPPSRCAVLRTRTAALLAVVVPSAHQWLPASARAELAAALRMIDYVVIAEGAGFERLIQTLRPTAVVRMEEDDERRARQLIEHVGTAH
jgi:bifunctional ADP-heptose synthase (sugar kinase/adenylyltransferase)